MKNLWRRLWLVLALLSLIGLFGVVGYGLAEPRSPLGHRIFHIGYSFPPTRPTFLSFYQRALREWDGGYLPHSVDQFLTDRLWECEGSREFEAIIDFQIRQRSGRWGAAPSQSHESLRLKIIASVMERIDAMPDSEAVSAMEFIESLRRGSPLHKGGFSGMYSWDEAGRNLTLRADRFVAAKKRFKDWWASPGAPVSKLALDPLEGSGLRIHAGI